MGIPLNLLLNPNSIVKDLLCGSCKQVLEEPVMLQPCEHTFCKQCIKEHHNREFRETADDEVRVLSCPVDEQAISGTRSPPPIYANLLVELDLQCPFHAEGCDAKWKLDAGFFEHRLKCEFNPTTPKPCVRKCGALFVLSDRPNHNCVEYLKAENQSLKRQLASSQQEVERSQRSPTRPPPNSTEEDAAPTPSKRVSFIQSLIPATSGTRTPNLATNLTRDELETNWSSLPGHRLERIAQIVFEGLPGGGVGNKDAWPRTKADCVKLAKSLELSLMPLKSKIGVVYNVVVNREDLPKVKNFTSLFGNPPSVKLAVRDVEIDIYCVLCK